MIAEQLIGKDKALAVINPDSFNKGIGITKGQWIGTLTDEAMVVVNFMIQKPVETVITATITAATIYVVRRARVR